MALWLLAYDLGADEVVQFIDEHMLEIARDGRPKLDFTQFKDCWERFDSMNRVVLPLRDTLIRALAISEDLEVAINNSQRTERGLKQLLPRSAISPVVQHFLGLGKRFFHEAKKRLEGKPAAKNDLSSVHSLIDMVDKALGLLESVDEIPQVPHTYSDHDTGLHSDLWDVFQGHWPRVTELRNKLSLEMLVLYVMELGNLRAQP